MSGGKHKYLTYKERQDVVWSLDMWSKMLDAQEHREATESAARLRRLIVKFVNGERG